MCAQLKTAIETMMSRQHPSLAAKRAFAESWVYPTKGGVAAAEANTFFSPTENKLLVGLCNLAGRSGFYVSKAILKVVMVAVMKADGRECGLRDREDAEQKITDDYMRQYACRSLCPPGRRAGGVLASAPIRTQLQLRDVAKAHKVTKIIIGATLYMRSYGVEYYSRSSRMPHIERQIFETFCALRAKANFGSNFRKPVAGPNAVRSAAKPVGASGRAQVDAADHHGGRPAARPTRRGTPRRDRMPSREPRRRVGPCPHLRRRSRVLTMAAAGGHPWLHLRPLIVLFRTRRRLM